MVVGQAMNELNAAKLFAVRVLTVLQHLNFTLKMPFEISLPRAGQCGPWEGLGWAGYPVMAPRASAARGCG